MNYSLIASDTDENGNLWQTCRNCRSTLFAGNGRWRGAAETELERLAQWIAKSLQNSGAADSAAPTYRRAKLMCLLKKKEMRKPVQSGTWKYTAQVMAARRITSAGVDGFGGTHWHRWQACVSRGRRLTLGT